MIDSNVEVSATVEKNGRQILRTGMIVTWDIYHNRISSSVLKSAMSNAGYTNDMVNAVPSIDVEGTVKKTAQRWRQGRGRSADKYKGEVLDEDTDVIVLGVLKRIVTKGALTKDSEASWEQVDKCVYIKAIEGWDKNNLGITAEAASMRQSIDKALMGLDGNDIRVYCVDPVLSDSHAIPLRGKGGVMFVPIKYEDNMLMIRKLFADIPAENNLSLYYCARGGDQSKDLRKVLASQVEKLSSQVDDWRNSDRKTRSDTEENFFGKLSSMQEKVQVYEESLREDLSHTLKMIKELKASAEEVLSEQQKEAEEVFAPSEGSVGSDGVPKPAEGENVIGFQNRLIEFLIGMEDIQRTELLDKHGCSEGWLGYMSLAQKLFK